MGYTENLYRAYHSPFERKSSPLGATTVIVSPMTAKQQVSVQKCSATLGALTFLG